MSTSTNGESNQPLAVNSVDPEDVDRTRSNFGTEALTSVNLIEFAEPQLHSSSIPTLPSFNALNEIVRRNLPSSSFKLPDLKRSNISYSGNTCVRDFILQVEEFFLYKNFSEPLLVGSFSDLLTGTAAKWFRIVRSTISSWPELKAALLKRFDTLEFDYHLESELRTRKQKPSESLPEFITDIMDMANRLAEPLMESVLITIVMHNMLPVYMPFVVGRVVPSLDAFIDIGRQLEMFVDRKPVKDTSKPKPRSCAGKTETICLKCNAKDHLYKNCPTYPGMICFKCKKPDVTTRSCDVCNPIKPSPSKN